MSLHTTSIAAVPVGCGVSAVLVAGVLRPEVHPTAAIPIAAAVVGAILVLFTRLWTGGAPLTAPASRVADRGGYR